MKNPYITLLKTSWKYAGKERKKLVTIYVLFMAANIMSAMNPLLLGWFVGKAQQDSSRILTFALWYAGAWCSIKLIEWAFHGPARVMERTLAFNLSKNFMEEKYHQTLHLPAKWHQDHHSGETINRIRKAYEALRSFFDGGFTYIQTFSKFLFSITAILIFSPLFGAIAVGMGLLTVYVIARFDKPFIKTLAAVNEKEHKVSSNLFDSLSNIRTVITLRLEKSMERGLMRKLLQVARPFRRNAVINEWKWFVAEMMITLIYCIIVVGFVFQHRTPGTAFAIAGLVTLLGYVNQFTSVFTNVANQYAGVVQFQTNLAEMNHISDAYAQQHHADQPAVLPAQWHTLEISKLSFSHRKAGDEQRAPQSLHNLHLHIKRGSKIALIGESGSGKSTLMSLLRGLYFTPVQPKVLVDGMPYSLDTIQETTTLFPQEPEIFENTIRYNITLGLPCSDEEIEKVCEVAHFNEVISQMPEGLQADIREKGVNLSGGQKQRLALARGILAAKDSELILLDEPTSSVDPTTEARIYQRLFHAFKEKAVISSIHRLHLLTHFDYIYMLHQGTIIGEGSLEHLLATNAAFQKMWIHQGGETVTLMTVAE
jgi:ATP-binding cassette subfamily B protein